LLHLTAKHLHASQEHGIPKAPPGAILRVFQKQWYVRYEAMKKISISTSLAFALVLSLHTQAAVFQFVVPMDGAQEFPGPGDPDGTGLATLQFDDLANSVTWDIIANNIDLPLTGAHIHQAPSGAAGPVRVDFSAQLSGGPVVDPDIAGILANPAGWYVNLHNSFFPAGAIRGQLSPEQITRIPDAGSSLILLGLASAALLFFRGKLG